MRLYIALTLIWKPFNALHNPLRNDDNADMLASGQHSNGSFQEVKPLPMQA